MTRTISFLILVSFVCSLAVRILLTATRRFDADEFEHLHASWMIHSGFLPYRDFWQNHTPLLYFLVAPVFSVFNEGIFVILLIRFFFSAFALFILWQTYLLARLDLDHVTSVLSVMVLSCSYLFLHKTIEIRPDHFLVASWLASLFLAIRYANAKSNAFPVLIAGTLLGIGMLATPKALLCLAAASLLFAANWIFVNRWKGFFQAVKLCSFYLLGFLIPFAACAAFFYQQGIFREFIDSTVTDNLNFPYARKLAYLLSLRYIVLFLLCAAGIWVCLRERIWLKGMGSRLLLAVTMIFLMIIFFFFLPASSPQSALVFVPLMSIYAGIAFKKTIEWYVLESNRTWKPLLLLILLFLTAVVVPCVAALHEKPSTPKNRGQLKMIEAILNQTNRRDVFFDGNIVYVFRPQAYYYGSLIEEIVQKIEQGQIKESIPQSLKTKHCKFVIYDDRIARLPENILSFLRNNYIPSEIPDVHIAGKQLSAENFANRKAKFWIEIPLTYSISGTNCRNFSVDGKPYKAPVFLQAGVHEIVCDRRVRSVLIRAAAY